MKVVILEALSLGEDMCYTDFEKYGEVVIYPSSTVEEVPDRVTDCDVIISNRVALNEATLGKAQNLKLICQTGTGFNNMDGAYLKKRGIAACNVPGYSTNGVAQHTFSLMFYIMGKLSYYDQYVKSGAYARQEPFDLFSGSYCELAGRTWGIIGMGAIGRRVADLANAFGCKVICYSASGQTYETPYEQVRFEELLRRSDFLSIHAPLNQYTENLLTLEAFCQMKSTAILINVARGPIVNEQDLCTALNENLIGGAALDVLAKEPMDPNSPLLQIQDSKKLLITPHIGWAARETRLRVVEEVIKNIDSFFSGESRNRVY